jgi:hypothetical protein
MLLRHLLTMVACEQRRILPARQRRWQHIAQTFVASVLVAIMAYGVTAAIHSHLTPLATSAAACPPPLPSLAAAAALSSSSTSLPL